MDIAKKEKTKEQLAKIVGWPILIFLVVIILYAIFAKEPEEEVEQLDRATYERLQEAYENGELDEQERSQFDSLPY